MQPQSPSPHLEMSRLQKNPRDHTQDVLIFSINSSCSPLCGSVAQRATHLAFSAVTVTSSKEGTPHAYLVKRRGRADPTPAALLKGCSLPLLTCPAHFGSRRTGTNTSDSKNKRCLCAKARPWPEGKELWAKQVRYPAVRGREPTLPGYDISL